MGWYRNNYLQSEDWKSLRAAMLCHFNNQCLGCRTNKNLDVHHIRYRKIWDVKPEDLWVLCRSCHEKIHAILKDNPSAKGEAIRILHKSFDNKASTAPS